MNLRVISRNVGAALLVSSLFMLLSIFVSVGNGNDSALAALIISFLITFIFGIFPFIFVRRTSTISLRDGYMIIFLSWLLSFIFGMLPYALWGGPFTLVNAWFESVSGFTTTGATILEEVEALPKSLLFWRASTHFIGGLGVVVFLLLVIPESSPVRLRLTNMEMSSISKEGYRTQARKTVYIFAYVYLGICALAFVTYMMVGMEPFDAICHAFSVCATGGFSTKTLSIGAFNNLAVDIVTIVFMYLASIHFGLIFMVFLTKSLKPLSHPVLKFYTATLALLILVTGFSLKMNGIHHNLGKAMLDGAFTVVSYASTTGFAISDNSAWPMLPCFVLILASLVCGCAGSTTGGVKADRILVLTNAVKSQIARTLHPSTVSGVRVDGTLVKDDYVYPQILYLALYMIFLVVSIGLCLLNGSAGTEAVTGSLACLSNVGPSLGEIGSYGNYNAIAPFIKVVFTMDMFLGRVEIYPVLAVFSAIFQKAKR